MDKLDEMIAETRNWRLYHRTHRNVVDASACAIREKALLDARAAIKESIESSYDFQPIIK